jgi:hypothetical protein
MEHSLNDLKRLLCKADRIQRSSLFQSLAATASLYTIMHFNHSLYLKLTPQSLPKDGPGRAVLFVVFLAAIIIAHLNDAKLLRLHFVQLRFIIIIVITILDFFFIPIILLKSYFFEFLIIHFLLS